ncbi:MAG: hypothetical protein KGO22_15230 [Gammaproteobacteria bacterium]|nr:hypothetical protein [Gammaproteobacteria bacterium]
MCETVFGEKKFIRAGADNPSDGLSRRQHRILAASAIGTNPSFCFTSVQRAPLGGMGDPVTAPAALLFVVIIKAYWEF